MGFSEKLRDNITDESVAYGYTLAVWGSGALLISSNTISPTTIMSFVIGGITGFALLALIAFGKFVKQVSPETDSDFVVASMIHILASFGTVATNYFLITFSGLEGNLLFLLTGLNTTFLYNIMLMAEYYLSRDIIKLERDIQRR